MAATMKIADAYVEITARTGKLNKGFSGIRQRVSRLSTGFKNLAKTGTILFAGLATGAILASRSFIQAASSMEDYEVRLETLLGSQKKATDAMKFFVDIASEVPFALDDIAEAGVTLEAMGAKHQKWLPVLSDLAAVMGIDVKDAASALGRAYAGGAGAADIFREKGILNIIKSAKGIKDLSKLTLPEFRDAMFDAFVEPTGRIAGAAKKLAQTWTGQLSMVGDAAFKLRKELGDALLPSMKELVTFTIKPLVNEWLGWVRANKEMIASNIKSFVTDLTSAINGLAKGIRFVLMNYQEWKDIFILGALEMRIKWIDFTTVLKTTWEKTTGKLAKGWMLFQVEGVGAMDKTKIAILEMQSLFSKAMAFMIKNYELFFGIAGLVVKKLFPEKGKEKSEEWAKAFSDSAKDIQERIAEISPEYDKLKKAQEKSTRERVATIEAEAAREKKLFEEIRKAYLKSMTERKIKSLEADEDIEDSSAETQEAITEKQIEEEKKRSVSFTGFADLWQRTQKAIFESAEKRRKDMAGAGLPSPATATAGAGAGTAGIGIGRDIANSGKKSLTVLEKIEKNTQKLSPELGTMG